MFTTLSKPRLRMPGEDINLMEMASQPMNPISINGWCFMTGIHWMRVFDKYNILLWTAVMWGKHNTSTERLVGWLIF